MKAPIFQRISLSRKILLGFVPLFMIFLAISVALHNHFQAEEMTKQARRAAHTYAEIVKEALVNMMTNTYEVDSTFLEHLTSISEFDTIHLLINDLRLRDVLLTPKRLQRLESKYRTLRPHDGIERDVLLSGEPIYVVTGERFRAVIPFNATKVCQKCHEVPEGYTLGAVDMHVSLEHIARAVAGNWRRSVFIFIGFLVAAFGVGSIMFRKFVGHPVERLVRATSEISRGNLDYQIESGEDRRSEHYHDELRYLAVRFDEMRESLRQKISQLDKLNRDLSERNREVEDALKRLREAQEEIVRNERLAVTGKMTAQLSHEINNPIHNIQSLLESSLRKLNGSEQARELITVALEEVVRMARLTRQMLDLYRTSMVEFEREEVELQVLLDEVARATKESLFQSKIVLKIEMPSTLPPVRGSRDKLKQVFLNLLANARDAMPEGGEIVISALQRERSIEVRVMDSGVGIEPSNVGKIFDAFFTTKKEVSGVGLGLSVSHAILQQHGGSISVESEVGRGTTFIIRLPIDGRSVI